MSGGNPEMTPDAFDRGMHRVKQLLESMGLRDPEDLPEQQPKTDWWFTLKEVKVKGQTFVLVPNKKGLSTKDWPESKYNEGQWVHVSMRNSWFYADQEYVCGLRINRVEELEVKPYQDEIDAIDNYLDDAKRKYTQEQVLDLRAREKAEAKRKEIQGQLDAGLRENSPRIVFLRKQLEEIEKSAPTRTQSEADEWHITDWRKTPTGPVESNVDLYTLKVEHKTKIAVIRRQKVSPLKLEQRRNHYHKTKWRLMYENIYSGG